MVGAPTDRSTLNLPKFDWPGSASRLCQGVTVGARSLDASDRRSAWRSLGELGVLGATVASEFGGRGGDPLDGAAVLEGLGRAGADAGVAFGAGAHMWAVQHPIERWGSYEQRQAHLPSLTAGTAIGAHATSEPEAGSDLSSLRTTATPNGDGWILDGEKTFITNAEDADLFLVLATTDRGIGFAGLRAFLLPRRTAGLELTSSSSLVCFDGRAVGGIRLASCSLPLDAQLGPDGAGMLIFQDLMRWERLMILAPALGRLQRQLDSEAQSWPRSMVGSLQVDVAVGRLLLRRAAMAVGDRRQAHLASAVKLHLSEASVRWADAADRLRGASSVAVLGQLPGGDLSSTSLDDRAGLVYSGTSELQRDMLARHLRIS